MDKKVEEVTKEDPARAVCQFCHISTVNSLMLGPLYQLEEVTVHYFCMLFSAGLSQNGEDEEGILGFIPKDIRKEIRRGDKLRCKFCRKNNATIGCSVPTCKVSYHFPCGLEQQRCDFHFIGNFESYCTKHKKEVDIPVDPKTDWECPICFCEVPKDEIPLWPPCCKKRVFHKACIMTMAKTHGKHFFKCPLCNDKDTFSVAMRRSGVYLPDRDAAWETEPNAFADHARLHNRCDAETCQCPMGRDHSSKSETKPWKIVRCGTCGAFAIHKFCGNLKNLSWRCSTCEEILSDKRKSQLLNSSRIQRRRYDTSEDEQESVETEGEPVMSVRDVLRECSPLNLNETTSSLRCSSDIDEDDEQRVNTIFDRRYGRDFVVDSSEDNSGDTDNEQNENPDGNLTSSSATAHDSGKTSATTSLSRSSEEIIYPDNVSESVRTSSPRNIPTAPSVSFPPLGRDKLVKGGNIKCREGRVELGETSEILSESNCQSVKISSNGVALQSASSSSPPQYSKTSKKRKRGFVSTKTDDITTGAAPTPDNKLNNNLALNEEELCVVHVGKAEPSSFPVVDLDEESSGSDLEVLSEVIAPKPSATKMSSAILHLLNRGHEEDKYKPPLPVRLGFDDHHNDHIEIEYQTGDVDHVNEGTKRALTFSSLRNTMFQISSTVLHMRQRGKEDRRNPTYFRGRTAESKNTNSDIVDLDSGDDVETNLSTRDSSKGEATLEYFESLSKKYYHGGYCDQFPHDFWFNSSATGGIAAAAKFFNEIDRNYDDDTKSNGVVVYFSGEGPTGKSKRKK